MTLKDLSEDFKKAKRIDFNLNLPEVTVYFNSAEEANVFYANLGEYFEGQQIAADFDIRNGFALTIFSIETGEEIINTDLEFINSVSYNRLLIEDSYKPFITGKFLFSTGFVHSSSNASINLYGIQNIVLTSLERLTIIKS